MPTWDDPAQVADVLLAGVVLGDDGVDRHRAAGAGDRHAVVAVADRVAVAHLDDVDRRQAGAGVLADPHAQPALARPLRRAELVVEVAAPGRPRTCP